MLNVKPNKETIIMYGNFLARQTIDRRAAFQPIPWPWDLTLLEEAYGNKSLADALESSFTFFILSRLDLDLSLQDEELEGYVNKSIFGIYDMGFLVAYTSKAIKNNLDTEQTFEKWAKLLSDKKSSLAFFAICMHIEEMLLQNRSFSEPRLHSLLKLGVEAYKCSFAQWLPRALSQGIDFLVRTLLQTKQFELIDTLYKSCSPNDVRNIKIICAHLYPYHKDNIIFSNVLAWLTETKEGQEFKSSVDEVTAAMDEMKVEQNNCEPTIKALCGLWLIEGSIEETLYPHYERLFSIRQSGSNDSVHMFTNKEIQSLFLENKGDVVSNTWLWFCCQKAIIHSNTLPQLQTLLQLILNAVLKGFFNDDQAFALLQKIVATDNNGTIAKVATQFIQSLEEKLCEVPTKEKPDIEMYLKRKISVFLEDFVHLLLKKGVKLDIAPNNPNKELIKSFDYTTQYVLSQALLWPKLLTISFDDYTYANHFHPKAMSFYADYQKIPAKMNFSVFMLRNALKLVCLYRYFGASVFDFLIEGLHDSYLSLESFFKYVANIPAEYTPFITKILSLTKSFTEQRNFLLLISDQLSYGETRLRTILENCHQKLSSENICTLLIECAVEFDFNEIMPKDKIEKHTILQYVLFLPLLQKDLSTYEAIFSLIGKYNRAIRKDNNILLQYDGKYRLIRGKPRKLVNNLPIDPKFLQSQINIFKNPKACPLNFRVLLSQAQAFFERIQMTNDASLKRQKKDCVSFIIDNFAKYLNLFEIINDDLFNFLNSFLASSLHSLERFLDSYLMIRTPFKEILEDVITSKFSHGSRHAYFLRLEKLLLTFSSLTEIQTQSNTPHETNLAVTFKSILQQSTSLEEANKLISKEILKVYLGDLITGDIDNQNEMFLINNLPQILIARRAMKRDNYEAVFDQIIRLALTPKQSFNHFFTELQQSSLLGQKIAAHNTTIQKKLSSSGIDVEKAFNYKVVTSFTFADEVTTDYNRILAAIWADVQNVQKYLTKFLTLEHPAKTNFVNLDHAITKFTHEITKGLKGSDISSPTLMSLQKILKGSNLSLLEKCVTHYQKIQQMLDDNKEFLIFLENCKTIPEIDLRELRAHCDHLVADLATLKNNLGQKPVESFKSERNFRIEAWDKNRVETLLLGNNVGCCLATNGGHFPALVQRWMDQAMLFHVVYEEGSVPVALVWLFFAENPANPGRVIVVANFFEIKASLGVISKLSDLILKQLLQFSGTYAKEIGAVDFIIRPLTYGYFIANRNITQFKQVNCSLQKIGGCLSLSDYQYQDAQHLYYLVALEEKIFFQYSENILLAKPEVPINPTQAIKSLFFKEVLPSDSEPQAASLQNNQQGQSPK